MNQVVDLCPRARRILTALTLGIGLLTNTTSWLSCFPAHADNPGPGALNPPPAAMTLRNLRNQRVPRIPPPAPAPKATKTPKEEPITVQSSKPIVSTAAQWQKWDDYINIKAGQEHIPLTLVFDNGAGGTRFEDLRIRLAGRPLATIKDFKGASTLKLNLTEAIGVGDSLLTVQGYGLPGARLSWKVLTPRPSATAATPDTFGLADKVTVQGKNFAERPDANHVTIGGKPVTVTSAKKDKLELKLSSNVPGGKQDLVVTVGAFRCNPIKVTVKAAPEVSSVDFVSTCTGQPITIYGKGFSTTASENEVLIGGVSAPITSATATSISCTVPLDIAMPQWYVPIVVKTNGTESKGTVTINLDQRVIPNEGAAQN